LWRCRIFGVLSISTRAASSTTGAHRPQKPHRRPRRMPSHFPPTDYSHPAIRSSLATLNSKKGPTSRTVRDAMRVQGGGVSC
jgi:hypothetical protein